LTLRTLHRHAEVFIAAPRLAVWDALDSDDDHDMATCARIAGAPTSGVGARHIHMTEPREPGGLRLVMHVETTAVEPGWYFSCRTSSSTFEDTETVQMTDGPDGGTFVRLHGLQVRQVPNWVDVSGLEGSLQKLAHDFLERLRVRVESAL
jgi:hypothetical protein